MKVIPMGRRLFVKLDSIDETKVGRIIIPDKHSVHSRVGTVLGIGSEVPPGFFEIGDRVWVQYHAGIAVENVDYGLVGDTNRIMTFEEIYGKLGE